MIRMEGAPLINEDDTMSIDHLDFEPDFGLELEMDGEFDIDAAFQEAIHGVASDKELEIEVKVQRMEHIVSTGTSELYRDFVDFRQMAAQMEVACMHDHSLNQAVGKSDTLTSFMYGNQSEDGHDHADDSREDDDEEIDPKTGKKKKKKRGWFGVFKD